MAKQKYQKTVDTILLNKLENLLKDQQSKIFEIFQNKINQIEQIWSKDAAVV